MTPETCRTHVVILEDRSQSVRDDLAKSIQQVQAILQATPNRVERDHLCFAGRTWRPSQTPAESDHTDIEAALDAANFASLDASDNRIILLTDGRATRGDGTEAARRLALRGSRVDVVPIGRAKPNRPRIVQVEPPPQSRVGVPASIRVTVQSELPMLAKVRLLDAEQQQVDECDMTIRGRKTLLLHFTPKSAGVENYWIDVMARETLSRSAAAASAPTVVADSQEATVYVGGPPRLLLCDNFPDEVHTLERALGGLNIPIDTISPSNWPRNLGPYAAVIISDWSGKELTPDQRSQLRKYVEEAGGGLVFIGGDNVLASKWQNNPLAEVLPMILQEKPAHVVRKQTEVSVCFVLDRSGSMGGILGDTAAGAVTKLDMVKASVLASVECLPEKSRVALVVFDDQTDVIVSPTPVDLKDEIAKRVDMIQVGGGTSMGPAVRKGLDLLATMPGDKYLIVLTDGLTNPPLGGGKFWDDAATEALRAGISWTSIAVGSDADIRLMSSMAKKAGGKYYYCDTANQIPQVFVKEARAIRRVSETQQTPFHPREGPAVARLKGLPIVEMPALNGRVLAKSKDTADQILLAEDGQPLLAEWQFGLGKVAGFTSDAKNAWARDWVSWQKYSTFWMQVVQGVQRPPQPFHVRVRSQCTGNKTTFTFHVQDDQGHLVNDLSCQTKLFAMSAGTMRPVELSSVQWRALGPAGYEASVRLPDDGRRYLIVMSLRHADGRVVNYCARASAMHGSEMSASGPDMSGLKAIAEVGHGICSENVEDIVRDLAASDNRLVHHQRVLWPVLIIVAILLWPVDLLIRKVA